MCMNYSVQMEKYRYTIQVEDCCVCLENKIMVILKCNHKVCNDCWYNITKEGLGSRHQNTLGPLCRNLK